MVKNRMSLACVAAAMIAACSTTSPGPLMSANINLVSANGIGASVGVIRIRETSNGVVLETHLHGLPPGDHGFHLHAGTSCAAASNASGAIAAAGAAGPHLDPMNTGRHGGPTGDGHLGDLPVLHVDANGAANETLSAPRLHSSALVGRALVIHANGDNFSDTPAPLGGGGARIACGIVESRS